MKVKPMGMLWMMLAGWVNRHQQDVIMKIRMSLVHPTRKCQLGRSNVVLAINPLSAVEELRSLGLQIRQRGVILVLENGGGQVGHRQMGNAG